MSSRGRRYLRDNLPQAEHQDHRCQADAQGARIDRPAAGHGEPQTDEDVLVAGAPVLQAEQVAHLGQGDQETGPGHEPQDHRFGDVAGQVAQLEHGDENLDHADHRGQEKGRLEGFRRASPGRRWPRR